ncbi:hypothetical protein LTR41_007508 [Exophiala xenobiotica]|nr:hypothetical protein LTR41_007508 [Exophiala xenobiotica]
MRLILISILASLTALPVYLLGVCLYNLFFHPYRKYPGPLLARTTPLHALWHAYLGDLHIDALRCHQKYGPYVRYSPNRLLVNTTTGLKDVYGQGKNFQKSKGYAPHPYFPTVFNTHNCIDKKMHGRKRRIVSQGFSESAMASSEQYVLEHVRNLCDGLIADAKPGDWSEPRDMAMWSNYFTLDVISDLTFGRPFSMITSPKLRWMIDAIVDGNRHIYLRFAWPWLFNFQPKSWFAPARWLFPEMETERTSFTQVADDFTTERLKSIEEGKCNRQDIMSALLAARDPRTGEKLSIEETCSEAHLMIAAGMYDFLTGRRTFLMMAGGDTTSTALSAVLFYLSRNNSAYLELAKEIRSKFADVKNIRRGPTLSSCHYLRACLDEALRLAPAAPGALWREAGAGGAYVDGDYIPQGCDVAVCVYALSHDSKYFSDPFKFDPSRFLRRECNSKKPEALTTAPEMAEDPAFFPQSALSKSRHDVVAVNDLDAFAPFLVGPRSCPAKPLAYLELSLALAQVMWLFDFEPFDDTGAGAPGLGTGRERPEEFQIVDMFSSNKQGPVLRFRRRDELLS